MTNRFDELSHWLRHDVGISKFTIAPASSDASFRRYFRIMYDDKSVIAMDAPPETENSRQYVIIAQLLHDMGLNVPVILEADLAHGFLLISDLGDRTYLNELTENNAHHLYDDAIEALVKMQIAGPSEEGVLPGYNETLLKREMGLFPEWFLTKHLSMTLSDDQQEILENTFDILCRTALLQPRVCVHRDFHSRNLMITEKQNPGILDFQDAVIGPITYDLVSLLRDCYIAWPYEQVSAWIKNYQQRAQAAGAIKNISHEELVYWFDLMGVQRHLKAIGIFARLNIRDSKPGYLQDIPRTLGYVVEVSKRYPELRGLYALTNTLLQSEVNNIRH